MYRGALVRPLLALALLAIAAHGHAQPLSEPIGYIMTLHGEVTVSSRGQTIEAAIGQAVIVGSILRTGDGGSVGVTLTDNSQLSFGPHSEFTVDDYRFEPARDALWLKARLTRGTLNYVAGTISLLAPDAVVLRTPGGVLGVRGGQVLVKVGE